MASLSRPAGAGLETETADDFILGSPTSITSATFTGLLPSGTPLSSISQVEIELYHVFPVDSGPASGSVPTRANSPSDHEFAAFSSMAGDITISAMVISPSFTAANSVVNGINKSLTPATGGEGAVTGEEVQINVTFNTPLVLSADHYFFRPEVALTAGNFLWLSTARSSPLFPGDLQAWIRNANLAPDWLRIGTDIVGGGTPPTFNEAFSLAGTVIPEPSSVLLLATGLSGLAFYRKRRGC